MKLGARLTKDRLDRLMTIKVYAEFLGISESSLYGILAGRRITALTKAKIMSKLSAKTARTA